MTNLLELKRMNDILKALDKMHHGLLALIEAHHELENKLEDRIKKLEDAAKKDK